MIDIEKVKQYWQEHPLYGYELKDIGTKEFFDNLNRIKRLDIERFSSGFWEFNKFRNKLVLDIGCGPGWLTVNYALNGAKMYAIDLTPRAVSLTKDFLRYNNVSVDVAEGNAEDLAFSDNYFDLVVSSGVFHHTPNPLKAMQEACRVLKPGGRAKITLYYKGVLHRKLVFNLVRFIMKCLGIKHPGADLYKEAKGVDDFIRMYDGFENPIGIGKTRREWSKMLKGAGLKINSYELHYFPIRFIPFRKIIPVFVHYLLDKYFGTMIYFDLYKPKG